MGRQPFGLASPAAWLREAGCAVRCLDLAVQPFDEDAVREADLVAFFVPMHLATRLAVDALARVRRVNPRAHTCFYGLYAPVNEPYLRALGVDTVLGGEFEEPLLGLAEWLRQEAPQSQGTIAPLVSLQRQRFRPPDRSSLPGLAGYARFVDADGEARVTGYTEASRGCKHRCRHCPIVPVYDGRFRIVQRETVLHDIRQQVAAGARHITFGDPDFFNGIGHAIPIVEALHAEHPDITYDVTVKVEHLLRHAEHLPTLRRTGCALVTSAVESFDAEVLRRLDKGHSPADVEAAILACGRAGLPLAPTFVAFTPWTSLGGYLHFLAEVARLGLVPGVAPVQYAIRLLIPRGSRILELPEMAALAEPFDPPSLTHPWRHPAPLPTTPRPAPGHPPRTSAAACGTASASSSSNTTTCSRHAWPSPPSPWTGTTPSPSPAGPWRPTSTGSRPPSSSA
jgi:radical SAM superfamily enzyme YgiQ (UPF0313 family)